MLPAIGLTMKELLCGTSRGLTSRGTGGRVRGVRGGQWVDGGLRPHGCKLQLRSRLTHLGEVLPERLRGAGIVVDERGGGAGQTEAGSGESSDGWHPCVARLQCGARKGEVWLSAVSVSLLSVAAQCLFDTLPSDVDVVAHAASKESLSMLHRAIRALSRENTARAHAYRQLTGRASRARGADTSRTSSTSSTSGLVPSQEEEEQEEEGDAWSSHLLPLERLTDQSVAAVLEMELSCGVCRQLSAHLCHS